VKVLDFGLARATDPSAGRLTSAEVATGTPLYMSPEQIQAPMQVDGRGDIYAVGAVGYFLLTGTPVFNGSTMVEICMHHIRTPAESISQRLGRPVSPELEALLLKCLEKIVTDRPQSAKELREALEALPQAKTWTTADAERWWVERAKNQAQRTAIVPDSPPVKLDSPGPKREGVDTLVARK
jgi:serine/threonine protein kinase